MILLNTVHLHGIELKKVKKCNSYRYTPAEVDRNYLPNVEIIADLAGALYQLNNALIEKVGEKKLPLFDIKSRRKPAQPCSII